MNLPSSRSPRDPASSARLAARGQSWWRTLKEADARRPDLPGEHVVVLGLGVLALVAAGRSRSMGGRLLGAAIGGALVGRAASGKSGLARLVSQGYRLADSYLK